MRNRADPAFRRGGIRAPMTTGCHPATGLRKGRDEGQRLSVRFQPFRSGQSQMSFFGLSGLWFRL